MRRTTLAVVVIAATALSACGKKPAPVVAAPAPAPAVAGPKPVAPPPRLTGEQTVSMDADFARGRAIAKEADGFREAGRAIAKEKGQEAANDTWVKAKHKYQEALTVTERWVEGELHVVTDAQVKAYLGARVDERGAWIKAISEMGKLHE